MNQISINKIVLGFILFGSSFSFADTLTCKSKYTELSVAVLGNNQFGAVKAISLPNRDDQHGSVLFLNKPDQGVSNYGFNMQAVDDVCDINLPNILKPGAQFVAHLRCYDQNGKMVNDSPVEGMAGPISGEAMNCSVQ